MQYWRLESIPVQSTVAVESFSQTPESTTTHLVQAAGHMDLQFVHSVAEIFSDENKSPKVVPYSASFDTLIDIK